MKKVLIGLAAGALAVTAMTAPVSAGGPDYDPNPSVNWILGNAVGSSYATLLIDSAGLDEALGDCGNTGNNNGLPNYTVFFPAADAVLEAVLEALDLSLGQVLAQPSLVKTVLLYHVVKQDIAPVQLLDDSNTVFNSMGGLTLVKTNVDLDDDDSYDFGELNINGYPLVAVPAGPTAGDLLSIQACNGWVYLIAGFLAPNSAIATTGLTADDSVTQAAGSGEGLPKTGSESLALTYAALASLIAGAGVLVIRRRSVA